MQAEGGGGNAQHDTDKQLGGEGQKYCLASQQARQR